MLLASMDSRSQDDSNNSLDDQRVQSGHLAHLYRGWVLEMFLFPFSSERVLVSEDEVDFVGRTTFVLFVVKYVDSRWIRGK